MLQRKTTRFAFVALLAVLMCAPATQLFASTKMKRKMMAKTTAAQRVNLMPSPLAQKAGLQSATGFSTVDVARGIVTFSVTLAPDSELPAGSVLEGWISSAGRKGGPGMSSASENDQKYGPAYGMADTAMMSRDLPYSLSTGVLHRVGKSHTYVGHFKIDNSLMPYGGVAVTIESDGNNGNYDPRPGTPILEGMIAK